MIKETVWRLPGSPCFRKIVTGCWELDVVIALFCWDFGPGERRMLTVLSPPDHVSLTGWPAWTEAGKLVNAMLFCAVCATADATREAQSRKDFVKNMLTVMD